MTDGPPLLLGVLDAVERGEEPGLGVDRHEVDPQVRAEGPLHLLPLVQPEEAGVDEDAGELIADGLVHQRRGDRRVDTA